MSTHVEFPKWKYASDGRAVIVNDPGEEAALVGNWADTPAVFAAGPADAAQSVPAEAPAQTAEESPKPPKSPKSPKSPKG